MNSLPEPFVRQMQAQLGNDADAFFDALNTPSPTSVRLNRDKKLGETHPLLALFAKQIPYCTEGYVLSERPTFTLDPTFHAGAYYVQEASSMFVSEALRQTVDLTQDLKILDLCAAPGGKSTLISGEMSENSFLVANEVIKSRVDILKENVVKWGNPSVAVTNHDPEDFAPLKHFFDVILIDAPCSGEGLFRKDPNAAGEWSPEAVQTCAARQKRIVASVFDCLKPNGILLYSTCTYNTYENEENARWITENGDFEAQKRALQPNWGAVERAIGYQFYPHRAIGEGFYLAVFKKKDGRETPLSISKISWTNLPKKQVEAVAQWLENPEDFAFFTKPNGQVFAVKKAHLPYWAVLDKHLKRRSSGLELGEFKGQDFVPAHDLALSSAVKKKLPHVDLDLNTALKYLKKDVLELENAPQGWVLARYANLNLGWMKVLKNRVNNYLPKDFRIRMNIE